MLSVKKCKHHDWQCCEYYIVYLEDPLFVEDLTRKCTEKAEPKLRKYKEYIFIESVCYQV